LELDVERRQGVRGSAIDDALGGGVPMGFLEGERAAEKALGEALAAFEVTRAHGD
jgi:hypothetical protein